MKRFGTELLALTLVLCMLTGCAAKQDVVISGSASSDQASAETDGDEAEQAQEPASAEPAEASAEATEPESDSESDSESDVMTPSEPQEIGGLVISDLSLEDCMDDGLYGIPYDTSVVYAVNGVTNGSLTLKTSPTNELCLSCNIWLESADSPLIETRVFQGGELLVYDLYDVELNEGDNSLTVFIKLQDNVSGSYRVELWYNDQPAAAAEYNG